MKALEYRVGGLYEVTQQPEKIYNTYIPFAVLPTLEDTKKYYFDEGFYANDYEEIKQGDIVVFLCDPIVVSTKDKLWGYVKLLTQNGYVGWTLFNEDDFKKIEK